MLCRLLLWKGAQLVLSCLSSMKQRNITTRPTSSPPFPPLSLSSPARVSCCIHRRSKLFFTSALQLRHNAAALSCKMHSHMRHKLPMLYCSTNKLDDSE